MTYDAKTYSDSISRLSDDELVRRIHLSLFNEEALPIALMEVERRKLEFNPQPSAFVIENNTALKSATHFKKIKNGIFIFISIAAISALKPAAVALGIATSEPSAQIEPLRPVLTEHDLRIMADTQNKTLPIKTSANLELTRIDPGPGMKLTYQVRVLSKGITKQSISAANIATVRDEAIKESCVDFRAGLESGVTYVMAYNATDGENLFSFSIVDSDC